MTTRSSSSRLMQSLHVLKLLVLLVLLQTSYSSAGSVRLNSTLGLLEGFEDTSDDSTILDVYYGVPFAKPPLDDLRFKPPVPAEAWSGVRNATVKPNSCWQLLDTTFGSFKDSVMWNANTNRSEDCLYLNVWIPKVDAPKAILVWIYGGGFFAGSSTLDVYDGSKLAVMNGVIVVSMNYRLGPLGFLYTGRDDAPGNVGLMDQTMALQWVYDNAEAMGGDRTKITIFGESAGAASVGMHLFAPPSRDIFTRAVMMSASPTVFWGLHDKQEANRRTKLMAGNVNCSTSGYSAMMSCLRSKKPEVLLNHMWGFVSGTYLDVPFSPVIDGSFIPDDPQILLARGEVKNASLISGVVRDEGTFWVLYGFRDVFSKDDDLNPVSADQFDAKMMSLLTPLGKAYQDDLIKQLTMDQYYYSVPPKFRTANMFLDAFDDISGDTFFKCPVVNFTDQYVKMTGNDVYQYSFEHRLSNTDWPDWFGVAHGYEIEAFFGIPFLKPGEYNDADRDVSRRVMEWLTQFAKIGVPSDSWPLYTNENKEYLTIRSSGQEVRSGLRHQDCKFWNEEVPLIQKRMGLADDNCLNAGGILTSSSYTLLLIVCVAVFMNSFHNILDTRP